MKEVGTFWELEDGDLWYLIIGKFDTYNSVVYYDGITKTMNYTTLVEDDMVLFKPSINLEVNNKLIEEMSKQ